jgi:hypothetical protein
MEKLTKLNWNTIPAHVVINIADYLPSIFQMELRLVNKHWKSALNILAFQSLKKFNPKSMPLILQTYGPYVKVISGDLVKNLSSSELKVLFPNLSYIKINLTEYNLHKSLNILKAFANNLQRLEVCSHLKADKLNSSVMPGVITSAITSLSTLNCLNFFLSRALNPPFPQFSLLNLTYLRVRFNHSNFNKFMEEFKKLEKLESFKVIVSYYGKKASSNSGIELIAPSEFLIHDALKTLSFKNHSYPIINQSSVNSYLNRELLKLFTNPLFFNLNNFEWKLLWSSQRLSQPIFTQALPNTLIWANLIRICLSNVDEYLLTYIIKHCPNLVELVTNSPLALPNCENPVESKPLKKLKRLRITGFDKKLIDNEALISRIFPNIETLCAGLQFDQSLTNQATSDTYYIPLLFPSLKFLILQGHKYELTRLITSYDKELMWEELFIDIAHNNVNLLDLLVDKLPNARLIYSNLTELNNFEKFKSRCIRLFNAKIDDSNFFSPNINFELNLLN